MEMDLLTSTLSSRVCTKKFVVRMNKEETFLLQPTRVSSDVDKITIATVLARETDQIHPRDNSPHSIPREQLLIWFNC